MFPHPTGIAVSQHRSWNAFIARSPSWRNWTILVPWSCQDGDIEANGSHGFTAVCYPNGEFPSKFQNSGSDISRHHQAVRDVWGTGWIPGSLMKNCGYSHPTIYVILGKILIKHRILGCLILGPLGIRNQTEDFQNLTAGSHQMEDKRNLYLIMEMCSGGLSKDDIFKRCFVLVWAWETNAVGYHQT